MKEAQPRWSFNQPGNDPNPNWTKCLLLVDGDLVFNAQEAWQAGFALLGAQQKR
jgi:hypothetical protein